MSGLAVSISIALFFGLSALFSGMETGGYLLNRVRVRYLARRGHVPARRMQRLLGHTNCFIFSVLIGNNVANYLLARGVTNLFIQAGLDAPGQFFFGVIPWNAETAAALSLMLPLFFFGELVPKNIFRLHADRLMYRFSAMLVWTERLLRPVTLLLCLLFERMIRSRGRSEAPAGFSLSLQGFHDYFSEESATTSFSDHQREMIRNLTFMHRIPVRSLMRPLPVLRAIQEQATVRQALDKMREQGCDRLLVCRGSVRRTTGIVLLFDLMDPALESDGPIRPLVLKPVFVSDRMPLTQAVGRMRKTPELPALVFDRSSRTCGWLALNDVTERMLSSAASPATHSSGGSEPSARIREG